MSCGERGAPHLFPRSIPDPSTACGIGRERGPLETKQLLLMWWLCVEEGSAGRRQGRGGWKRGVGIGSTTPLSKPWKHRERNTLVEHNTPCRNTGEKPMLIEEVFTDELMLKYDLIIA